MKGEDLKLNARLLHGKEVIPIYAEYDTRYSLLIRFSNGDRFPDGFNFSKLLIQTNGHAIKIGPCKFISNKSGNGFAGRLVLLRDVFDFKSLFFDKTEMT